MAITISEEHLPVTLTASLTTDEEFLAFCEQYPDHFIETNAEGEVLIMPPNYPWTGLQGAEILAQLKNWARLDGRGVVTDASGGFVLPNGARRAPDAAWISRRRLSAFDAAQIRRFLRVCPEFVIELRSPSDRLRTLRAKMREWVANGAELAWMIDPERRSVEVFRPGCEPEVIENADSVSAGAPIEGFTLDLKSVWDPLA